MMGDVPGHRRDSQLTNYPELQFLDQSELNELPFASRGGNLLLHSRAILINIENISIGHNVRIDADVTILATGPVTIGSHVHIGAQCYLAGAAGISIGDFAGMSQGVKLYSASDDYSGEHLTNPTIPREHLGLTCGKITLGQHAIIGAGSVVLPGVNIADGCAVGALSLVRTSTEPWGIYAGIPATRRKERSRGLLARHVTAPPPRELTKQETLQE